ncbi:hypothetical protein S83_065522 [Arachis hypogaea]
MFLEEGDRCGKCIAILVGLSSQLNSSEFIDSMKTTMSCLNMQQVEFAQGPFFLGDLFFNSVVTDLKLHDDFVIANSNKKLIILSFVAFEHNDLCDAILPQWSLDNKLPSWKNSIHLYLFPYIFI